MYDSNIKQDTGGEFVSEGMFFPEQPCYHIEILEWIDKEDITDEWRYVWMYDPPEPVYSVTLGGFVEPLSLAFVYECIYTKSEYEQIKQTGFDYQTLSWMTHILTDCPDDFDYEKDESTESWRCDQAVAQISALFTAQNKLSRIFSLLETPKALQF